LGRQRIQPVAPLAEKPPTLDGRCEAECPQRRRRRAGRAFRTSAAVRSSRWAAGPDRTLVALEFPCAKKSILLTNEDPFDDGDLSTLMDPDPLTKAYLLNGLIRKFESVGVSDI